MFGDEQKKRQRGTGFTNIGKIMGANVGAGQQMAGKIAQGVQSAGQKAQQQLGQAQQQFKTGFQQATQPALGAFQQGSSLIKGSGESEEDYSKRIKDAGVDYSKIGKQVQEAKYGGPKGLEDMQGVLGSAVGASQLGGLTTSGLGQQQLAKQFIASRGAGYTKGQGSLDELLLGQSPEAQAQLKQARESVAGLGEQAMGAGRSAMAQAQAMQSGIEKEKSRVLGGIQSSIGEVEQRATEKGQQYSRDAQRIVNLLRDPSYLGKTTGDGGTKFNEQQAAYDRKLLQNISKFGVDATGQAIDTSDPAAMMSALQEIANKGTTGISKKYGDPQRAALQKLAQFQQDEGKAAQIAAQKDKSAFQLGGEDIKGLASVKTEAAKSQQEKTDIEKAQRTRAFADEFQRYYNEWKNAYESGDMSEKDRRKKENEFFTGIGRKYGFSDQEIQNMAQSAPSKGEVLAGMFGQSDKTLSELGKRQTAREKSQMSLQNYINKLYGLS